MGCLIAAAWFLRCSRDFALEIGFVARNAATAACERVLGDDHPITRRFKRVEDGSWNDWTWL